MAKKEINDEGDLLIKMLATEKDAKSLLLESFCKLLKKCHFIDLEVEFIEGKNR